VYYTLALDAAGNLYVPNEANFGYIISSHGRVPHAARRARSMGGTGVHVYTPPFTSSSTPAFEITSADGRVWRRLRTLTEALP
jgi:hypothetical protein